MEVHGHAARAVIVQAATVMAVLGTAGGRNKSGHDDDAFATVLCA
jgi:hypothetical protein